MIRHKWRRFLPKTKPVQLPVPHSERADVMERVLGYVPSAKWRSTDVRVLDGAIDDVKRKIAQSRLPDQSVLLETLLVLQAPRAAQAQRQMDEHRHNFHDREKRLFELIDFNDSFVDTVLNLPPEGLPTFVATLREEMAVICRKLHVAPFTDEQLDAIVRGLSREIATYRGAIAEGFGATMTNRAQDAFGIDMIITDKATNRSINIDCKSPSSFRYRLEELVKEEHITEDDLLRCDAQDYCTIDRSHDGEQIWVTILCIRPELLGDVENFVFKDTAPLAKLLREVLA